MPPFPYRAQLDLPVIGIEAELKVFVDDTEVAPESIWRTPADFIEQPLLRRTNRALQLPTGGAVYFDGGVIELVTPVIEIAPECTARAVRSIWEQVGFVREQLDRWEREHGQRIRLQAFSAHYNVSFEMPREERGRKRNVQKLALLLAYLLPVPVMITAANRRSTAIGVRPRRERVEITLDFTPDPALMAATAALIVGIVREVVTWPSYLLGELESRGVPILRNVEPGKHPSRNGWVVRDYHFPRNPYAADIDHDEWETSRGPMSLRRIARAAAEPFRDSIRHHAGEPGERLLFAVLEGEAKSLLDLADRPPEYDDVRVTSLPSPGLSRSDYEKIVLRLANRRRLLVDGELLTPVAMKGWYHSLFRSAAGEERMLTLDQILAAPGHWE